MDYQTVPERLDEQLLLDALQQARSLGADYAEVRAVDGRQDEVRVRNGQVGKILTRQDSGWGLNVRVGSGWGFAASARLDRDGVREVARQALELAAASNRVQTVGPLLHNRFNLTAYGEPSTARGEYATPLQIDPFKVPISEQLEMLFSAENNLKRPGRVKTSEASLQAFRTWKFFANTAGAHQRQIITECGGGLSAIAMEGTGSYQRTYGRGGNFGQAGYEYILGLELEDEALRVGQEVHELVAAEWVPDSGPVTVILGTNLAALMVHETCGHPTELDRVLGSENAFAGGSFLQPEMLQKFAYGSPAVNLTADATLPGALGTFGWDDEGTPAQRVPLVEKGLFSGYLSSRDTAAALGLSSGGMARSSAWSRIPIVRMTNVSLEADPAGKDLAGLMAGVDKGLYLETPSSWSLDDKRMNFHFSAEYCQEIRGGQPGRIFKGASFQGRTPEFWGGCQAVGGPAEWRVWGFLSCAKGEPLQTAHVAHGAAPAIIQNVRVQREG